MSMSKWKPIETAPKDGTFFLAYDGIDCNIPFVCYWALDNWRFHGKDQWKMYPNVWMPLPEPPEVTEQEQIRRNILKASAVVPTSFPEITKESDPELYKLLYRAVGGLEK